MRTSDYIEKDLMFALTDGSKRRGRYRTRWKDEIQGTLTMNWHGILNATQNGTQTEVSDLQGRGNQQTMKRDGKRD